MLSLGGVGVDSNNQRLAVDLDFINALVAVGAVMHHRLAAGAGAPLQVEVKFNGCLSGLGVEAEYFHVVLLFLVAVLLGDDMWFSQPVVSEAGVVVVKHAIYGELSSSRQMRTRILE